MPLEQKRCVLGLRSVVTMDETLIGNACLPNQRSTLNIQQSVRNVATDRHVSHTWRLKTSFQSVMNTPEPCGVSVILRRVRLLINHE